MRDPRSSAVRQHAIVIGGSLAGLLATRVLADHFERVTLIERDRLAHGAEPRKGVPQGNHVHGLLARGQQILSNLFPDLIPALLAGGAVSGDMGLDMRWHHFGVWKPRFETGIKGMTFTRPYLEGQVAARVQALRNVAVINASVDELVFAADRRRVLGVEIRSPAGRETLNADLVVDAGGRGSQTPRWLAAAGYEPPGESSVKVNLMYATRFYRPPAEKDWVALMVAPRPPGKRMAVLSTVEGNRMMVTLGGWLGDHPSTDEAGYLEFARGLPVPDVHQVLQRAEPLSPILTYRFPGNLRRRYDQMKAFPDRLLVMGDAFCSFNPVYAQGMTVSALEAMALDRLLTADLAGLPRRFHQQVAKIVAIPWQLTTGEDFRHAETIGKRPMGTGLIHWYTARMHKACADDPAVALAFHRVVHMLDAPTSLFRPSIMARVLRHGFASPERGSLLSAAGWPREGTAGG